ncbi:hypothetical protein EVG20_g11553 [Dentipellis fragilis]|uniref:Cryptic loci regulator 2 N-terminal domain-containing protein n=1 Tax=Dentipellis fragilis TaxID=205917 RepID=A0A4Y9XKA5_9AGAM|nr:hypothetical protein EVG20_g11553 [Dentipellis fragilis]
MPAEHASRPTRRFKPYPEVINVDTPTPSPSLSPDPDSESDIKSESESDVIDLTTPPPAASTSIAGAPPPATTTSDSALYGQEWRDSVRRQNQRALVGPDPVAAPSTAALRGVIPTSVAPFSDAPPPVLKPAETTRGGYDGATRYYTIHENVITILKSDANPTCMPNGDLEMQVAADGTVNYFEKVKMGDGTMKDWLKKLGAVLANEVAKKPPTRAGGPTWTLSEFPQDYVLWMHYKGKVGNPRKDPYLYGSSIVNQFRSPKEFAPHAIWLMEGGKRNSHGRPLCKCQYCSGRSQMGISNQLQKNMGKKVTVHARPRRSHAPPAEEREIQVRDQRVFSMQNQNMEK